MRSDSHNGDSEEMCFQNVKSWVIDSMQIIKGGSGIRGSRT